MSKNKFFSTYLSFIILFLLICILFSFRFFGTFSFNTPMHVITGGAEDSGLLGVWLIKNGQVGFDHFKEFKSLGLEKPELHTVFHYNWLLYYSRSYFVLFFQNIFKLNDLWLPTLIRIQTFILSIFCMMIFSRILSEIYKIGKIKNLILSFFILFGPLTGFWVISAKPDFNYIIWELLAFYLFLKNIHNLNFKIIILISMILFLSFSTKQTSIILISSISFYLLINKQFKYFFLNIFIFLLANLIAFYFLGFDNLNNIFLHGGNGIELSFEHFFNVLVEYIYKSLPVTLLLILIIFYKTKLVFNFRDKKNKFIVLTMVFCFLQIIPSFHIGSSVNYYFMLYFISSIVLYKVLSENFFKLNSNEKAIFTFSNILQSILILLIFAGIKGNYKPFEYPNVSSYAKCVEKQNISENVFIDNITYYRLPWISKTSEENPILITMIYQIENQNINIEKTQIYKAIKEAKFDTLILKKHSNDSKYDLSNYTFSGVCFGNQKINIYKKRDL